jgi:hypothetical protein
MLPANSTSPTKARLLRRGARRVAHGERHLADLHRVAVGQPARRRKRLGRRHAEHPRLLCQPVDPVLVVRVRPDDRHAEAARQLAGAAGVVDVRVREQDLRDAHGVPLRGSDDAIDLAARIDHRRLARPVAPDQ